MLPVPAPAGAPGSAPGIPGRPAGGSAGPPAGPRGGRPAATGQSHPGARPRQGAHDRDSPSRRDSQVRRDSPSRRGIRSAGCPYPGPAYPGWCPRSRRHREPGRPGSGRCHGPGGHSLLHRRLEEPPRPGLVALAGQRKAALVPSGTHRDIRGGEPHSPACSARSRRAPPTSGWPWRQLTGRSRPAASTRCPRSRSPGRRSGPPAWLRWRPGARTRSTARTVPADTPGRVLLGRAGSPAGGRVHPARRSGTLRRSTATRGTGIRRWRGCSPALPGSPGRAAAPGGATRSPVMAGRRRPPARWPGPAAARRPGPDRRPRLLRAGAGRSAPGPRLWPGGRVRRRSRVSRPPRAQPPGPGRGRGVPRVAERVVGPGRGRWPPGAPCYRSG